MILTAAYCVLAVVGAAGTWWFNLRHDAAVDGDYLGAWFATPASTSLAVDVLVVAAVACVFIVVEARRLHMRWWVHLLLPAVFLVAVAFALPLFLAIRERHLTRTAAASARPGATVAPPSASLERLR